MLPTLCFICCDYLYPEMKAAVESDGFSNVEVKAFPARCGRPPIQWKELEETIKATDAEYIELFGSFCLQQLDDPAPGFAHCTINKQEQCFHYLAGTTLVTSLQQNGGYLLSPGWLAEWENHVHEWGFDRETAADYFGQSLRKLVLLDTGTNKNSREHLQSFAAFLNLPSEILSIGLDYHRLALSEIVASYNQRQLIQENKVNQRNAADSAMVIDLLVQVTRANSETEVKKSIIELFTMLLAPANILFIWADKTGLQLRQTITISKAEQQYLMDFYTSPQEKYQVNQAEDSFLLRIGRGDNVLAILHIQHIAFPKYIEHYLNVAIHISEVCALAIEHAQTVAKLLHTSRLAGKAEIATEVLHNVGNILNSISVSSEHIHEITQKSSCLSLPGIVDLIEKHSDNPGEFFTNDPKGKQLPLYFSKLSDQLTKEQDILLNECRRQLKHIHLVAEIIRTQQDTAKEGRLSEQIDITDILEEYLQVFKQQIRDNEIAIERKYTKLPEMYGERYKILQIINNLISNAIDAFDKQEQQNKTLSLTLYPLDKQSVILEVHDNGMGIKDTILQQIFVFGFSTKDNGHGFGLHNAANLATEMNGTLLAESPGEGKGALFRLQLPVVHNTKGSV